jgi:hypothetical protein
MGKSQRVKGQTYEREVAKWLSRTTEEEYVRNLSETRDGASGDVLPQDFNRKNKSVPLVFVVEAKRQERMNLEAWLDQAEEALGCTAQPHLVMVAHRASRKETVFHIRASQFEKLIDILKETP